MKNNLLLTTATFAILCFVATSESLAQPYEVSSVPTLDFDSVGRDLNDGGTIVGAGGAVERALVVQNGNPFYIGGLPGGYQFADKVNNRGLVAGRILSGKNDTPGVFTFDLSSGDLSVFLSTTASWINDLNEDGVAVGSSDSAPTLWTNGSQFLFEDLLKGGSPYPIGDLIAIDNSGTILASIYAPTYGAIVASPAGDGGYVASPFPFGVYPVAISDSSRLVLALGLDEIQVRSLDGGPIRTLQRSSPDDYLSAHDINDAGLVVGSSASSSTNGFLWNSQTGERQTLTRLIRPELHLTLLVGNAINNRGEILAQGVNAPGAPGIYKLIPPCFGDVDNSGIVTLSDLSLVLSQFGTIVAQPFASPDLNGDGMVNLDDLQRVLSNFGRRC